MTVTIWVIALLVFSSAMGAGLAATVFYDSRLRELRQRIAKLEYEAKQYLQRQEFLIALMQRNGVVVPTATEINIGAGGEMHVGGDVAGRDKAVTQLDKSK